MSQAKASLEHPGSYWSGVFNFLRSRRTYFARNETTSGPPGDADDSTDPDVDDLRNVKLPEVLQAQKIIRPQLYVKTYVNGIQPNFICELTLDSALARDLFGGDWPPAICGKVLDIYPPYDPDLQQPMQFVNMQVLRKGRKATIVSVPASIISNPQPVSQFLKIPIWGAALDLSDLEGYIEFFGAKGIQLEVHGEPEALSALCPNSEEDPFAEEDPFSTPWLLIVTSDWLTGLSSQERKMICDKLDLLLIRKNARIINYHPRQGIILNDVAKYLPGESKNYFLDSHSIPNLIRRVDSELKRFLSLPM